MSGQSSLRTNVMQLPLFLLVFAFAALSMMVPALHGAIVGDNASARAFFYAALLGAIAFLMLAVVHMGRTRNASALGPLLSLFSALVVLPAYFAVPFVEVLSTTRFLNAYFEMLSAITTTGATMFDDPARLNGTLHLWRAQVGWMGGLLMWVAASAILAPLALGGFEITMQGEPGSIGTGLVGRAVPLDPRTRLWRSFRVLFPLYAGLTLLLWVLLLIGGSAPLTALCHAMSVLATSGISPVGGVQNAGGGITDEALMALFMLFALSRLTFSKDTVTAAQGGLMTDPEFRIGIFLVCAVPLIIFGRHFLGAVDVDAMENLTQAGRALWGAVFTVLSFLTTTGFVSERWADAQSWSGLDTSGLILMGLALMGGGVATTAGGVKLLRVYALYQNGVHEMERLVHPSSVSGSGKGASRVQRNGAFIAWVFFMLFALSLAAITIALSLTGSPFDEAMVLSVAMLSTTGPLTVFGTDTPIRLIELSTAAKSILCAAMVLGRLETLAIIALLTPDLWRN